MRELPFNCDLRKKETELFKRLRPHQVDAVISLCGILNQFQSAVDWSATGTGKTYNAIAVANILKLSTLAIVPKIAIGNWHDVAAQFGDTISAISYEGLRTGKSPYGWWDNDPPRVRPRRLRCTHCQCDFTENSPSCYCRPDGVHCLETLTVPHRYGRFNFHRAVQMVVVDESHRCSAIDSLNAEILIAAKRQGLKILGLSATAACGPQHMRALGYALDLFKLPEYLIWAARLGFRRQPGMRGLHWFLGEEKQKQVMKLIRDSIIPDRGVRITTAEIPGFPAVDLQSELYDMEDARAIEKLYREMGEAVLALRAHSKERDVAPDHPLTKMLRARQEIELLKVPVFTELAEDYLAKGFSVGFFVNYSQTLDELRKRFPKASVIDGREKNRDEHVARFQRNEAREILVNTKAGGESWSGQDLDGEHPRIGLVSAPDSANLVRQLTGRFPREGGKSTSYYRFIFARGTVEEKVHKKLRAKLNNLDALLDGDLVPDNLIIR